MRIHHFTASLLLSSALACPAIAQTSLQPNYVRTVQAESTNNSNGVTINGNHLNAVNGGDWFSVSSGNLGVGADLSILRYAKADTSEIGFEIRKGSLDGPIVASGDLPTTNGATRYRNVLAPITDVGGTNDLYVRFTGAGTVDRVDRLQFARGQRRLMHAEKASAFGDVIVEPKYISYVDEGDWIRFDNVNLGSGFTQLLTRYSRGNEGNSSVSVHLDDLTNPSVAELTLTPTGSWTTWRSRTTSMPTEEGLHDVYFNFSGGEGVGDFDYFMMRHQPLTTELLVSEADQIRDMSYFGVDNQFVGNFGVNPWMRFYRTSVSYNPDISVRYATQDIGVTMEVRKGSQTGALLATIDLPPTGGWGDYQTVTGNLTNTPQGMYNLTFKFVGGAANVETFTLDRLGGEAIDAPTHEEIQGTSGEDVFEGSLAVQRAFFGAASYDQVNYPGSLADFDFELQASGQVFVTKADGSYDILESIEGIWFQGEQEWYSIEDAIAGGGGTGPTHEEFQGTVGEDIWVATLTDQRAYFGNGGYDQVDYPGSLSDYNFELQANGQVFVIKPNGSYDILDSIEGIWFQGEGAWYSIDDAIAGSGGGGGGSLTAGDVDFFAFAGQSNADGHFNIGNPTGSDVFEGRIQTLSSFPTQALNVSVGGSGSNNITDPNIPYWWDLNGNQPGPLLNDAVASINQTLQAGEDLDGIVWAQGEADAFGVFYSNTSYATTVTGNLVTATNNVFDHFRNNFGADLPIFIQEIGDYPVPGGSTSAVNGFDAVRDAQQSIINADPNTYLGAATDGLAHRDDLHFNGASYGIIATDLANNAINVIDQGGGGGGGDGPLTHFGQDITLNGANVAWSSFGADVGFSTSNAGALGDRFAQIAAAGGNSARLWLHASGWVTPNVATNGFVSGISTQGGVSDAQVNQQVSEILDAAWDEGVVVSIALFSFTMMCEDATNKGASFNQMINSNYQSYLDNVLDPLVRETKDHPALFAYEIFNEADGMTEGTNFFGDNCSGASFPQTELALQRFVNRAAAEIKSIDRNVKVSSSISQTARLGPYTNPAMDQALGGNYVTSGTLDYYQAHWYGSYGHPDNPYQNGADARGLDRPIVIGEFGYGFEPQSGTPNEDLGSRLLDNGYAGAWVWDQTGLTQGEVATVISGASSYSPPLDQTAIEACINTQNSTCYNQ